MPSVVSIACSPITGSVFRYGEQLVELRCAFAAGALRLQAARGAESPATELGVVPIDYAEGFLGRAKAVWHARMPILVAVQLVLIGGASAYLFKRVTASFRLRPRVRCFLATALTAALVAAAATIPADHVIHHRVLRVPALFAFSFELATVIAAVLLGIGDALGAFRRLAKLVQSGRRSSSPNSSQKGRSPRMLPHDSCDGARRSFLAQASTGAALAVGAGTAGYGALIGRHDYVIEELVVPIPGLSPAFDGFTIVQISDVHVGLFVGPYELAAAAALLERAKPDLLVATGDLVDHEVSYLPELGAFLRRIESFARAGLVVVPGNHDYYTGIGPTLATARSAGARVLCNSGVVVGDRRDGFALVGVDDVWAKGPGAGPDLDRALSAVPETLPRVLLCHNPVFFPKAANRVALQLSGHTHGGQVNPGVRLADWALPFGYVAGEYRLGASRLYVNRGFGTAGPPARVRAPPEVTRVVLLAKG